MDLNAILKKDPASCSAEELAVVKANWDRLTPEEQAKFDAAVNGGQDSAQGVKALLAKQIAEAAEKLGNEASEEVLSNFKKGIEASRAKAAVAGPQGSPKANEATRKFLRALKSKNFAEAKELSKKAVSTDTGAEEPWDSDAGYLIPEELLAEIKRVQQVGYGVARQEMQNLPFSGASNTRKIPTLSSSVILNWVEEGGKIASSKPKFGVVTQTLKKLAGTVILTNEIIEDSAIDLAGLIAKLFAEATQKEEDLQFFNGSGTPWTGILKNTAINIVTQTSGDVNQLTADDLLDMIDATPSGALAGAKFYFHRTILSVLRKLKDEQGQYIYQRPQDGTPGQIWDYPYMTVEAFPARSTVTTNTKYILFGNLKNTCVFGDKGGMRVMFLDQATLTDDDGETVVNLAEQDMVATRITERVGYVVVLPEGLTVLKASATVVES